MFLPISVLDAPSNLGLRPASPGAIPGVFQLPRVLRAQGIVARLGAEDAGVVTPPAYSPEAEPDIGFRNGAALGRYSVALADRVGALRAGGRFVLLLGGDCSVLVGSSLALRRAGAHGLAFIDAHDDFSYVKDRARMAGWFTAAGLDLALATGHGPDALCDLEGLKPYLREEDVVHLGLSRTAEDTAEAAVHEFDTSRIASLPLTVIRERGAKSVGDEARSRLEARGLTGFWIHVDADVLDLSVMPAVDSPNPDGMRLEELTTLLASLLASPQAVGLELTILDPDLDPEGHCARAFTDAVVAAFVQSGRVP
ncbi:arginase family protein [Corallococcus sp. AB032C]|uniref:arginase family protein n=1 Tax=Corallococcus TaxID=83461 RepID=UPI000EEED2EC|nr:MULTISPECIES: arginase family protein [Corallococcus]NPC47128.1 arginase family protein [Corallococcus exiguus]RKH79611.1 arginase family protein [Corallococcus sp. AB032C]